MPQTQINGGTQIRPNTITDASISTTAAIADGKLAESYIKANGTRAFTSEVSGVSPTSSSGLATKGYVDGVVQGLDVKPSARAATNNELLTIGGGTVTQITGTTVDGISINVNDYVFVPNAPSTTGNAGGSVFTSQPANGLYKVTNNTTNLTVIRAPEQSGSVNPAGDFTYVEAGTYAGNGFTVTTPSSSAAFTYGTGSIAWTQFSGTGQITVDSSLTKNGNQLSRSALTGDVTASAGSNSTTIAPNVVTYSKFQQVAANSLVGNLTGVLANAGAVLATSMASASAVSVRDVNANSRFNNVIENIQIITSAGASTVLTVASPTATQITGTQTQTVVAPDATTLVVGQRFKIYNRSSGVVTVNANGGGLIQSMAAGSFLTITVTNNGSAAGAWDAAYTFAGGSGSVTTVSVVSANGLAGTVANSTTTPAITLSTTVTGLLKGNGTSLSAASLGTDYLAPSSRVTRETPSGTVNGSNVTFTLANTPIAGTEEVYYNGGQLEPGPGNDYTISGNTITMLFAPLGNDKIRVSYFK